MKYSTIPLLIRFLHLFLLEGIRIDIEYLEVAINKRQGSPSVSTHTIGILHFKIELSTIKINQDIGHQICKTGKKIYFNMRIIFRFHT